MENAASSIGDHVDMENAASSTGDHVDLWIPSATTDYTRIEIATHGDRRFIDRRSC